MRKHNGAADEYLDSFVSEFGKQFEEFGFTDVVCHASNYQLNPNTIYMYSTIRPYDSDISNPLFGSLVISLDIKSEPYMSQLDTHVNANAVPGSCVYIKVRGRQFGTYHPSPWNVLQLPDLTHKWNEFAKEVFREILSKLPSLQSTFNIALDSSESVRVQIGSNVYSLVLERANSDIVSAVRASANEHVRAYIKSHERCFSESLKILVENSKKELVMPMLYLDDIISGIRVCRDKETHNRLIYIFPVHIRTDKIYLTSDVKLLFKLPADLVVEYDAYVLFKVEIRGHDNSIIKHIELRDTSFKTVVSPHTGSWRVCYNDAEVTVSNPTIMDLKNSADNIAKALSIINLTSILVHDYDEYYPVKYRDAFKYALQCRHKYDNEGKLPDISEGG